MERADPSKVVIQTRAFDGGTFAGWVNEGLLKVSSRREVGPKQKSDVWDASFISTLIVGMPAGHVVIDMRTEPYRVIDGNGRIGAVVDFLSEAVLHYKEGDHKAPDLDGLSPWDFGLDARVINRKVREATFSTTCIMPGTGEREFDVIAQAVRQ